MNGTAGRFSPTLRWVGLIALAGLCAAAAFAAGKLLGSPAGASGSQILIAADQLPPTPPDAFGLFVRREDDRIFVGTGGINIDAEVDNVPVLSFDGPVVEVVVVSETVIYKETTDYGDVNGSGEVRQRVAAGTMDDLNTTMRISVWGRQTGDRIIAEVLLYAAVVPFRQGWTPQIESP